MFVVGCNLLDVGGGVARGIVSSRPALLPPDVLASLVTVQASPVLATTTLVLLMVLVAVVGSGTRPVSSLAISLMRAGS